MRKKISPLDSFRHQTGQASNKIKNEKCCNNLPDILGAVMFITSGIILLLNNFNIISWSIWNYLVNFWPVIFIFIGFNMISGNSWVSRIITTAIGLFIIAFILTYSLTAVDSCFRNDIYKKYPYWKKIYDSIPKIKNVNPGWTIDRNGEDYRWGNTNYFRN